MADCPVPWTCGTIDSVLEQIDSVQNILSSVLEHVEEGEDTALRDMVLDAMHETEIHADMERIRQANSNIREWGEDESKEKEIAQSEVEVLEEDIEKLEDEISDLQRRLDQL